MGWTKEDEKVTAHERAVAEMFLRGTIPSPRPIDQANRQYARLYPLFKPDKFAAFRSNAEHMKIALAIMGY